MFKKGFSGVGKGKSLGSLFNLLTKKIRYKLNALDLVNNTHKTSGSEFLHV